MRPGRGFVILALLWLAAGAAGFFSASAALVWLCFGAGALALVILDLCIVALLPARIKAERALSPAMALGTRETVSLRLVREDGGYLPSRMRVFDMYPEGFTCAAFPLAVGKKQWDGGKSLEIRYRIMPVRRRAWTFSHTELLITSPLLTWRRKISLECETSGKTFPDFKSMLKMSAPTLKGVYQSVGLKSRRRRGEGMEFLNLRDYREGDSVRSIDWRATSRIGKPIVRQYTEDQDQQVLLILDSGYRLYRHDGEYLQFDYALNAVLMLAYAALTHGDSVAVSSFGNDERWLPPRKGKTEVSRLLNQLYDIECAPVPSSPFAALEKALERLHKRTFIILVSNLREEDGESLSWILPKLQKKHLLLAVSLTEADARYIAGGRTVNAHNTDEMLEKAAAVSYLNSRRRLFRTWEHSGLLTLESVPSELSSGMINSYLDVKRSGRL